jgi:hypothetical protein
LKEVDLVACPFAINLQRYKAVQFVAYIGGDSTAMLTKYPDSELSAMATVQTFTWQVVAASSPKIAHLIIQSSAQVWVWFLASFVAVCIACRFYIEVQNHLRSCDVTFDRLILYLVGTVSSQGGWLPSGRIPLVTLAAAWCLACTFLLKCYCCTLTVHLSSEFKSPEVNSISQLASSSYQLTVRKGSIAELQILVEFIASFA